MCVPNCSSCSWICLIHLRGFTKASNIICADRVATKACTFTSVQHVELPVICHSCWCWRVHAGFLVGNDGMLPLVTFLHFMSSLLMASLGFMSRLPQMVGEKKKKALLLYDGTRLLAHTISGSLKLCFVTICYIVCIIATICLFA